MDINYHIKYLYYKYKYIQLKSLQKGGGVNKNLTYKFENNHNINYNHENFIDEVNNILNEKKGWNKYNYTFTEKHNGKTDFIIILTPMNIIKSKFPQNISWTVFKPNNIPIIYINEYRWKHGSNKINVKIEEYRKYLINHEVGHVLGFDHETCNINKSKKAPVMMQQTLGIGQCEFNPYP